MKKITVLFFLIFSLTACECYAQANLALPSDSLKNTQEGSPHRFVVGISVQAGIGFSNHTEANRYIADYLEYYGFNDSWGNIFNSLFNPLEDNSTMNGIGAFSLGLTLGPTPNTRIRLSYDYAKATNVKDATLTINGRDDKFTMKKNGYGILVDQYIPIANRRSGFITGIGVMFNHMTFEEFEGNNTGIRLETGYGLRSSFGEGDFIAYYDFANAKVSNSYGGAIPPPSEINFSGIHLAVRFTAYFKNHQTRNK